MAQVPHTKTKIISDIILNLTQGNPSDDLQLEEEQVAYWIQYTLHDLIRREILEYKSRGQFIPPVYILRDIEIGLQEESVDDVDNEKQRIYAQLDNDILDLPNDGGIVRVLDYDRNIIHKTSVESIEDLRNLRFAAPSLDNVLYYREGRKIFIEGFNSADVEFNPIMVSYVPKQDILSLDDDDEILITDQLVPILIDQCIERGKLLLYGSQADQANDGVDNKDVQYHTAISNPTKNDQQQQSTEQTS